MTVLSILLPAVTLVLSANPMGTDAHKWSYVRGAIAAGHDIVNSTHTLSEAFTICDRDDTCRGFTYDSNLPNFTGTAQIFFKTFGYTNLDPTWSSYIKDKPPPPPDLPMLVNPCRNKSTPQSKQKWCDPTIDISDRVNDMISHMTLGEKISSLRDASAPIDSLGLPYYDWWSEATHGVASGSHGARNTEDEPYQTNFPFPITTAMSFNRSLWRNTGSQIGKEARAFMNEGNAYSTFWAPVINLARDPRWGRNIECPGEDPYLSGEYATAFVQGMERSPVDPGHLQASACCKHYAANSMEHTTEGGQTHTRHDFDANISMQDLVDTYLAPFQACVEKGQVSGLMCSYNAINGIPTCADSWLLQDIARDTWGFDGYITSDCGAESDVFANHHFTASPEEAVRDILHAGTDSDCGGFFGQHAQSALDKHLISEADLDARLRMLFKVRMRLAHFDPPGPLDEIPSSVICSPEAVAMARDAVAQSCSLVKNLDKLLPYDASSVNTAAVIGPNAKQSWEIYSYYGPSTSCNESFNSMVDAVSQYVNDTVYIAGLKSPLDTNTSGIAGAAAAAKGKDAVVVVLGTDLTSAHEEMDAHNITFPPAQLELLAAVAKSATNPVTVVVMTAIPLDLSVLLHNPKIGAILHVGQPSVQTLGIGDVLFGKQVPAGRTIQTVYPAEYANQVSIFDFNMRPGPSAFPRPDCVNLTRCPMGSNPGRTYRFYTGNAVVPFGFGLSYTSFEYKIAAPLSSIRIGSAMKELLAKARHGFIRTADTVAAGPAMTFEVHVSNTGDRDADDVVLGFLTPPEAGKNGVPIKTLFGFQRVFVPAGKTVVVFLYPSLTDFTFVDTHGNRTASSGMYTASIGVPESHIDGMGYDEHHFFVDTSLD